jgi:hypothetical protein
MLVGSGILALVIVKFAPRPFLIVPILLVAAVLYTRFPFLVGIAIFIMITLLSIEWMIRKLLRLA